MYAEERQGDLPVALRLCWYLIYTPGLVSLLMLSWLRVPHPVRSSAASAAIAAGSSIRSGSPCRSRERRPSSAPALRMTARSSWLSGPRGGRRVSRRFGWAVTSSRSGLGVLWSVVGHHLPGTTSRVAITSSLLLSNACGEVRIGACTPRGNLTV
jgi:hypothetical protein